VFAAVFALCVCLPAQAHASESMGFSATLKPQREHRGVTVELAVKVNGPPGALSAPLSELTIDYPAGLGIELSELGIETCAAERVEAAGPRACPPNSIMGYGSAVAQTQIGGRILHEHAHITLFRAPGHDGRIALLADVEGAEPLIARVLFTGALLPAEPPFGGAIRFTIPLPANVSLGGGLSLVNFRLLIGPPNLVYYERIHGRVVAYRPQGVVAPSACPRDGLPFSASARFVDAAQARTHTRVPCRSLRA
jgi:hypothetical protein